IEDLPSLVKYFETQLRKLGVRVELRREFTLEMARALKPEVVVVATGGQRATPAIPGIERQNVLTGEALERKVARYLRFLGPRLLGWVTRFWLPVGKRVVVIGGQLHGCQVAEFLVKRGRQVTVVEASDQLGEGISVVLKTRLLDWLAEKGVAMLTGAECKKITDEGIIVRTKEGTVKTIIADTVITALPPGPNSELSTALVGVVPEVYPIGDCSESRLILQAIADGSRVGHSI
ncbi:MAG: FAD-dependent oxidoreductase, partial [Betaproteobacteria bacterium]|nr:FAD-dependent oxidoreductase [Betaproteobacteria bacterium]